MGNMKIAMFTDPHFGEHNNSIEHNELLIEFINWMLDECDNHSVDRVMCLGDYFHTRNKLDVLTINYGIYGVELIKSRYDDVKFLKGNHDLYYKNSNDVSSMNILKPYVDVVDGIEVESDTGIINTAWISSAEMWDELVNKSKENSAKYIFGHFEFTNFWMNNNYKMEYGHSHKSLSHVDRVFTGHYHNRQHTDNVVYVGTPFPFNYSDVNDPMRGFCILDTETGEYEFINSGMNNILEIDYKDFLEVGIPDNTSQIRVRIDEEVEESVYNSVQFKLNEIGLNDYKIEYTPQKIKSYIEEDMSIDEVENIDQFVLDFLDNSSSDDFDKEILKRQYKGAMESND